MKTLSSYPRFRIIGELEVKKYIAEHKNDNEYQKELLRECILDNLLSGNKDYKFDAEKRRKMLKKHSNLSDAQIDLIIDKLTAMNDTEKPKQYKK